MTEPAVRKPPPAEPWPEDCSKTTTRAATGVALEIPPVIRWRADQPVVPVDVRIANRSDHPVFMNTRMQRGAPQDLSYEVTVALTDATGRNVAVETYTQTGFPVAANYQQIAPGSELHVVDFIRRKDFRINSGTYRLKYCFFDGFEGAPVAPEGAALVRGPVTSQISTVVVE